MSDGREKTTNQTHCDRCNERVYYALWESKYYFSGLICTSCYDKVIEEVTNRNGDVWYDFVGKTI
jgi:formylmethanofuran dehydrogenase subunit E